MNGSRSNRPEVRNPVLALPSARRLHQLDPASRAALRAVLEDLRRDAHPRAETHWRARKGWSAAYWRAVGVYSGHLSRALRDQSSITNKEERNDEQDGVQRSGVRLGGESGRDAGGEA
jgi:hypothetical protein